MDCKHYSSNLQALLNHMRKYGWDKKAQKFAEALSKEESVLFVHVVSTFLDEYDWKRYRTKKLNSWKDWLDGHFEMLDIFLLYPFLFVKLVIKLALIILAIVLVLGLIISR